MAAGNNQSEDKWLYCAAITDNSNITRHYPQSYHKIRDIVEKEKCKGKTLFTEEKAIYLEIVEGLLAKGKRNKIPIVDFTLGITHGNSKKYRLIEAKFEVTDLNNIDTHNIREKVNHSKDVMRVDDIPIEGGAIILVSKGPKVQQQINFFSRQLRPYGNYQIMTSDDLYYKYFVA